MEALAQYIATVAILFAIVYAIVKAIWKTLFEPIHAKLDRLLAMQEEARDVSKA